MAYRWKPSRSKAREFAQKMSEIDQFCAEHGIEQSRTSDSYYFIVNGRRYRVSNHTVEASNAAAYDEFGRQTRSLYHADGRQHDVTYIYAGKTRLPAIYMDIVAGYELDGRGYRKEVG